MGRELQFENHVHQLRLPRVLGVIDWRLQLLGAHDHAPLDRGGYWVNIFNTIQTIGRTTQVKV